MWLRWCQLHPTAVVDYGVQSNVAEFINMGNYQFEILVTHVATSDIH